MTLRRSLDGCGPSANDAKVPCIRMYSAAQETGGCFVGKYFVPSYFSRMTTCSPIFYMRKKVQKDLADSTEELRRFDINW